MAAADVVEVVRASGGCGEVSPDGARICIKSAADCPPHGWEEEDDDGG